MVIFGEMIESIVNRSKLDVGEKKKGIVRKKEWKTQAIFLENQLDRGYTLYLVYPNYLPYYLVINNVAPSPYFYQPPRLANLPAQMINLAFMP